MSDAHTPSVKVSKKTHIKIAVIYHSEGGTTKNVAEAVAKGAEKNSSVTVDLLTVAEGIEKNHDLLQYDAFILGGPTYFGSISSELKKFLEKTSHYYYTRGFQDKLLGAFTNSASQAGDKTGFFLDLFVYASQNGMLWVPLSIGATNNRAVRNEDARNRAGHSLGLATQSYIDAEGQNPPAADINTAEFFGERLANVFVRYYE